MIDPFVATAILAGFLAIWGIVIPVCGVIPRVREAVSLRYMTLVVFLAATIGVIVDFSGLDDETRKLVIMATAILAGLFLVLRSVEKAFYHGWIGSQKIEASVEKGDIKAKIGMTPQTQETKETQGK